MPRLLVIDDRDQTVDMVQRQLPEFDTVTRCDRRIPCQVCEERERGCPLRCAHDYAEAAQALARLDTLPDLVVLDLHFALPEEKLLPEDKSSLPPPEEPKARKTALDGLRRKQGLLILEKLRATYPKLPVVMLTTTGSDLGAERPADPLVYLCENEVVDSRSLAAEISRALALHHSAQEGPIFWGRARAMAELRRAPNRCDARSGGGTVDRSVTTSGPLLPERGWITCSARKLLPVPVSPSISSGSGDRASVSSWRRSSAIAGARPQKMPPSCPV